MELSQVHVKSILTRTTGFLTNVTSHSLQPYRGCALGSSLCGVGCYVQHSWYVTRGRPWGSFVEARTNAADVYETQYERERRWARANRGRFGVFLSSSTEPFQPAERMYGVTRGVLERMVGLPPDLLILQTHSHRVVDYLELYLHLGGVTDLRVHVSIESDRDRLPGLPPAASSVEKRIEACGQLHRAGLCVVVTAAPLMPIAEPETFFARLAEVSSAVVIDHFVQGDGSPDAKGSRTRRTPLPLAMEQVEPRSVTMAYRDEMVEVARRYFGERVGTNVCGFAGTMLASVKPGRR